MPADEVTNTTVTHLEIKEVEFYKANTDDLGPSVVSRNIQ